MKVAVIGTGYVGLVAGACFADTGNDVICVDKDLSKIDALKAGRIPIYEPGLDDLVLRNVRENRLSFTTSTAEAVKACDIVFFAVGTPPLPNGDPNLSYLQAAAEEAGRAMDGFKLFVNKSTVPIFTQQRVTEWIASQTKHPFEVVSNPEFLKEGTAVTDFLKPDRVVIGARTEEAFRKMEELYAPFVRQGNPILRMDPTSAEITKYACNSFLAARISFMNELALLCEDVGGDVEQVRKGMATDPRIGKHFLYAGVGYGGSCFPKDVQALLATARQRKKALGIIEAAETANERQKKVLAEKIRNHFEGNLQGRTFGVLGLAFKPNTDDLREAPALTIIQELLEAGAQVRVFDPVAMENAKRILEDRVIYCESMYETIEGTDAMVLVTEWNEFRNPDFARVKRCLKQPVVFDGRNIYEPAKLREAGFAYYGIGRAV